jgi:autotransporter adhesin
MFMKTGSYIAIVAVLASGLSLSAFAKDKNETKISLSDSVQVGTTGLKPGDYTLQWEGNGPDVQVKVLKGKNVVATAPAKLAQGGSAHADAITIRTVSNVKTLDQIDFAGGKRSLVFEATGTQSASGQE